MAGSFTLAEALEATGDRLLRVAVDPALHPGVVASALAYVVRLADYFQVGGSGYLVLDADGDPAAVAALLDGKQLGGVPLRPSAPSAPELRAMRASGPAGVLFAGSGPADAALVAALVRQVAGCLPGAPPPGGVVHHSTTPTPSRGAASEASETRPPHPAYDAARAAVRAEAAWPAARLLLAELGRCCAAGGPGRPRLLRARLDYRCFGRGPGAVAAVRGAGAGGAWRLRALFAGRGGLRALRAAGGALEAHLWYYERVPPAECARCGLPAGAAVEEAGAGEGEGAVVWPGGCWGAGVEVGVDADMVGVDVGLGAEAG